MAILNITEPPGVWWYFRRTLMEATMLEQIFPKGHRPYTQSPVTNVLEDFANWLVDEGYKGTALRAIFFV